MNTQNLKALLIEDNVDDALMLADYMDANGFKLDWIRVDNEVRLTKVINDGWDIVFSDFSMPGFSGERALEIFNESKLDIPFIFVSGTIGEETAAKAIKDGANDYVLKDNLSRLVLTVSRELREAKVRKDKKIAENHLKKLSLAINQSADSIFITNTYGEIEYINPAFCKMTGYEENEILGLKPNFLTSAKAQNVHHIEFWLLDRSHFPQTCTLTNRKKNGASYYEERMIKPIFNEQDEITHFVGTSRDITIRTLAEISRKRLANILELTPDIVLLIKPPGEILYANGAAYRLLGAESDAILAGKQVSEVFPKMLQNLLTEIYSTLIERGNWAGETVLKDHKMHAIPVSVVALVHQNERHELDHISIIARDISERKNFEETLQHRATHDDLTGLPNRFYLVDRFNFATQAANRSKRLISVLFIDLDNFKRVNDSFGHAAGDLLLQQVAKRLDYCLSPNDTIARNGGDEFTVLITNLDNHNAILKVIENLQNVLTKPVFIRGTELYMSFSVGIASYPQDGETMEILLQNADTAMYQAKRNGLNQYCFYATEMNSNGQQTLVLESELRHALIQKQFELFYQPQVDLQTGTIIAAEALIRWRHPSKGLISPGEFIPLLENTGLIIPVGEWVILSACQQIHDLASQGIQLRISANVSTTQFRDKNFINKVAAVKNRFSIADGSLELEITEDMVMQDPDSAVHSIQSLQSMGVRTAIDDFGTGYSSFAYLKNFPINILKIDQIFVRDLNRNGHDAAIVETSIYLAKKLGLKVVAEGVENAEQLHFLREAHCDIAQGFLISKPLPQAKFLELLHSKPRF